MKLLKTLKNKYLIATIAFLVWMVFLDANSLIIHYQLNTEIQTLEAQKMQLKKEIASDKKALEELQDLEKLEKYARENYFMKKEGEEIFLIEINDINSPKLQLLSYECN